MRTAVSRTVIIALWGLLIFPLSAGGKGPADDHSSGGPAPVIPDSSLAGGTSDPGLVLKGGEDGTVFRSLTVEGEDRIKIVFGRPALDLDLAPREIAGLGWVSTWEEVDMFAAVVKGSAFERPAALAQPWLSIFAREGVARFHPQVSKVHHWKLTVADSRGTVVRVFEDDGNPPAEIVWDGLSAAGDPVMPGLVYSFLMETFDRAGNRRSFAGEGFMLPPFRVVTEGEMSLIFSGEELPPDSSFSGERPALIPPIIIEAATWINQVENPRRAIRVETAARSHHQASLLARRVAQALREMLLGDPDRIKLHAWAQEDAPDQGTVAIKVEL
ncbi:MAG: hypothetical protein JXB45_03640 [Candidatus Krumholzibacteriota bacterium]|nr:hypothetical protein [Candidatus Krumholzibacteriota bacterium]